MGIFQINFGPFLSLFFVFTLCKLYLVTLQTKSNTFVKKKINEEHTTHSLAVAFSPLKCVNMTCQPSNIDIPDEFRNRKKNCSF